MFVYGYESARSFMLVSGNSCRSAHLFEKDPEERTKNLQRLSFSIGHPVRPVVLPTEGVVGGGRTDTASTARLDVDNNNASSQHARVVGHAVPRRKSAAESPADVPMKAV